MSSFFRLNNACPFDQTPFDRQQKNTNKLISAYGVGSGGRYTRGDTTIYYERPQAFAPAVV
jgi:hypothetical protein